MIRYRSLLTVAVIVICVFFISQCINKKSNKPEALINAKGEQFAGSATCAKCHKDIYEHHLKTAHYLTSQPALEKYIKGSFEPGKNIYAYDPGVKIVMEKRDTSFFQVEYLRGTEMKALRLDIVIGSGTMGQSFLHWNKDHLFQLPITFFTAADAWSNSPGFPDKVIFNRIITSRCMECHATFMQPTSQPDKVPEAFSRDNIIYGVDCEKCHGPAAKHVEFQTQNPRLSTSKFIINPAKLSRQQNLDLCALCHGGKIQKTTPSFQFTAGNKLSDYFVVDTSAPDVENIDVHGNQYGLLSASKCFRISKTLTCITCHNTHEKEKGKLEVFSQRCMGCHNTEHEDGKVCKLTKTMGSAIKTNCIDCHMPLKPSKVIAVQLQGGMAPVAAMIRSHFISVYPVETKRILEAMKKIN